MRTISSFPTSAFYIFMLTWWVLIQVPSATDVIEKIGISFQKHFINSYMTHFSHEVKIKPEL